MKIILSRKGFDSGNGGHPSPILGNRIISLPINECKDSIIKYSDLRFDHNKNYYDLMHELGIKEESEKNHSCHLDPDIDKTIIHRETGWKGVFGQYKSAQSHLIENQIKKDDLFLFFGWFREISYNKDGELKYSGNDLHVIFGYLQVDEILNVCLDTKVPDWLKNHPHCSSKFREEKNNTIYIARSNLSFNNNLPGYGVFKFDVSLVLTKNECSRSKWDLPELFKKVEISYHSEKSWIANYFQSARRGQEFVIEENAKVENWVKKLFEKQSEI